MTEYIQHRYAIIIVIVMVIASSGNAQEFYSRSYDIDYGDELIYDQFVQCGIVKDEGMYLYQRKNTLEGNRTADDVYISLIGKDGELQWQKKFNVHHGRLDPDYVYDGITSTENGIAFIAKNYDAETNRQYTLVFVDSTGNKLRHYHYYSDNICNVRAMDRGENGLFYIAGIEYLDTLYYKRWSYFLSIVDREGNEIIHRNYNPRLFSTEGGIYLEIDCAENGDLYISGFIGHLVLDQRLWVLKLNSIGEVQWMHPVFYKTDIPYSYTCLAFDDKYDKIYLSNYSHSDNYWFEKKFLACVNTAGDTLWQFKFKTYYNSRIYDISITDEGDILVCGYDRDIENGKMHYGWLAKLDRFGNILWQRFILATDNHADDEGGGMAFYVVQELDDGSIMLAGNIIDTVGGGYLNQNAWVVHLDSSGNCFANDCPEIYDNNTTSTYHIIVKDFLVYPNPADAYFKMILPQRFTGSMELLNMNGICVSSKSIKGYGEEKIDCSGLSAGVYLIVLYKESGEVYGRKQVIIQ